MATERIISIEKPGGKGQIYQRNEKIVDVSYNLDVQQVVHTIKNLGGSIEEVKGRQFTKGLMTVLDNDIFLYNIDRLTLHMEDGRKMDFHIKSGDLAKKQLHIEAAGGFY